MGRMRILLAALLLVASSSCVPCMGAADSQPPFAAGDWHVGRASWYGTPEWFVGPIYAKARSGGITAFGVLEWGGCGYTNSDGTLTYPNDTVASYADANVDFPGACGRCYEIKCKEGLVLGRNNEPVQYSGNYFYYPEYGKMPDSQGRDFPGNSAESQGFVDVKCWDPNKSVYVHIIDICPCMYSPKTGPEAGTTYEQASCCGNKSDSPKAGQHEFDLSFWAYEQLAHPMYPETMLQFRPVDCDSKRPIRFLPGYVSTTLYDDAPGTGWAFFPYETPTHTFQVVAANEGVQGAAACAELAPGGGMTFMCRNCSAPGYQPFVNVKTLEFWIKSKDSPGEVPPVELIVGAADLNVYCHNHVALSSLQPAAKQGDWLKFSVPMGNFQCVYDADVSKMDQLDFHVTGSANTYFCLDKIQLLQ